MPMITGRLRPLLKGGVPGLFSRRQWVVAALGTDLQPGTRDPHLDIAICTAGGRPSRVSQGVLVAGVTGRPGIGNFNVVAGEFGKDLTTGSRREFGKNVHIAILWQ